MKKEDDPNHDLVLEWFKYTCPHCGKPATEVHEIIPKSLLPIGWWVRENRIALCSEYHFEIHNKIGTRNVSDHLRDLQRKTLEAMYLPWELEEYYSDT